MGFFTFAVTGVFFVLIGLWESMNSLNPNRTPSSSLSTQIKSASISKTKENPFSSSSSFIFASIFALLIFLNSVISIFDAFSSKDRVGSMLQLQLLSIALLFLLYSALGLLNIYMKKSTGNYTIKCKDHPEHHRGRAIATLQFNCHLALLLVLVVGMLSIMGKINGVGVSRGGLRYRPLGAEMQQMDNNVGNFTLDSDDDLDDGIKEEDDLKKEKLAIVALGVKGHGSHA
ncbi:hypothetical protein CRYUN_Cryun15aG0025900 [Craigia yunnanensis]